MKDDEDEFLPGAPEAMAYLRKLVEQAEQRGTKFLISWSRRRKKQSKSKMPIKWVPIKGAKSAWRTAMKRIEAEYGARYRWHDIRAAFVTHVAIMSGGVAAQALARHSDFSTTRRYIHVADEVKRAAANKAAVRPALTEVFSKSPKHESQTREISHSHKSRKPLKKNGAAGSPPFTLLRQVLEIRANVRKQPSFSGLTRRFAGLVSNIIIDRKKAVISGPPAAI